MYSSEIVSHYGISPLAEDEEEDEEEVTTQKITDKCSGVGMPVGVGFDSTDSLRA